MQNLTLKLTPTANTPQTTEGNAPALNLAGLGTDNTVLDQQKLFADLFAKQLLQQRKMSKSAEIDATTNAALLNSAEAITAQATLPNGVTQEAGNVALAETKSEPVESATTMSPDMMLLQIQTPMAVNAPINTSPKLESQGAMGLQAQPSMNLSQSVPNSGLGVPILNDQMTPKNSDIDKNALLDAKEAIDTIDLKNLATSAEPVALNKKEESSVKLSESVFKDALAQVNANQSTAHSIIKSEPAIQAPAAASNSITPAFGKADWNQAINQKVLWMVGVSEQSATLTLNPPDLGPLQVVIQVDNQHVDTTFISDNPEVRQALEDGMQMLRDKMSESGIQLGNAHVNSGDQSKRDAQQMSQETQRQRATKTGDSSSESGQDQPKLTIKRISNGLVDTFA